MRHSTVLLLRQCAAIVLLLAGSSSSADMSRSSYGMGTSQSCSADSSLQYLAGGLWGEHADAVRIDSMLYVAAASGIGILDLSDLVHPRRVGFVRTQDHALLVSGAGTSLAAITYWSSDQTTFNETALQLYSLESSTEPVLRSETHLPHQAVSFTLSGDRAYILSYVPLDPGNPLAGFEVPLDIYDVSDLAHPQFLGTCILPNASAFSGTGPVVRGETLIVPAGRLFVVNIQDPVHPCVITSTESNLIAISVAVSDSLFYVVEQSGAQPVNYAALSVHQFAGDSLQRLSFFEIYSAAWAVSVIGTTCLVDADVSGTLVFDESDPTNPVLISCIAPSGRSLRTFTGDNSAVTVNQSVSIPFPYTEPGEEWPDYRCEQFDSTFPNSESSRWNNEGDIVVTDLTDPYSPVEAGRYDNPGYVHAIGTRAPYVVAISDDSSLYFLASAADSLEPVYTLHLGGIPTAVAWEDSLLFVAERYGLEIAVFDGLNSPHLISSLPLPSAHSGQLAVQGNYVFICCDSALMVIDASDPTQPVRVGKSSTISFPYDVAIRDHYAFVCDVFAGVAVLDISTPALPQEISRIPSGWSLYLALRDSLLLVADAYNLDVFDVGNPAQGHRLGGWAGKEIQDLGWVGSDAAVANLGGLSVLDLTDPTTPRLRYCYTSPGFKRGVAALGDTIYVASSIGVERLTLPTPTDAVIEPENALPKTFELGNPYPNPFNATVSIPFALDKRQRVKIEICNALGQKVAMLLDKELPAGEQKVTWQANSAPSGVYFIRATGKDGTQTRRIVMVK